jgi:hypothetical protein
MEQQNYRFLRLLPPDGALKEGECERDLAQRRCHAVATKAPPLGLLGRVMPILL